MNCVLFAKMDQVFSKENKTLKKILENWKKNSGKVREFCQSGKVGSLYLVTRVTWALGSWGIGRVLCSCKRVKNQRKNDYFAMSRSTQWWIGKRVRVALGWPGCGEGQPINLFTLVCYSSLLHSG